LIFWSIYYAFDQASKTATTIEAVNLNNQALQLSSQGNDAGAEYLHMQALQLKEAAHGADLIQAVLTQKAFGEVQFHQGKYDDDTEANLCKVVKIRNASGKHI
jgi:hypothetical protein